MPAWIDRGCHPDFTQELPRKLLPPRAKEAQSHLRQNREFTRRCLWRVGSSLDLKRAHNPKVAGSNPAPATIENEGLADVSAANPFRLPRNHPGSRSRNPESATGCPSERGERARMDRLGDAISGRGR